MQERPEKSKRNIKKNEKHWKNKQKNKGTEYLHSKKLFAFLKKSWYTERVL